MNRYKRKVAIGITGASGAIYAQRLLKKLEGFQTNDCIIDLVFSKNALDVWKHELDENPLDHFSYRIFQHNDYYAPFASGSAGYDTLIICPCSMGTMGRIANGVSSDLISRAADVMLKEGQKLIIVPRESPYNLIHLKNLIQIKDAGGIIIPASPSFYSKPKTIIELVDTIVDRVIKQAGFTIDSYSWGE